MGLKPSERGAALVRPLALPAPASGAHTPHHTRIAPQTAVLAPIMNRRPEPLQRSVAASDGEN